MSNVAVDVACPPVYEGPSCNELSNIVASIELEESGLIVEVADSLVANGGRGLFVRLMDGVESVTLDAASPFCGYASGSMQVEPDALGGKTVAFLLGGLDTAVFFEGRLATIRMLLQDGENIERIAGHDVLAVATAVKSNAWRWTTRGKARATSSRHRLLLIRLTSWASGSLPTILP